MNKVRWYFNVECHIRAKRKNIRIDAEGMRPIPRCRTPWKLSKKSKHAEAAVPGAKIEIIPNPVRRINRRC